MNARRSQPIQGRFHQSGLVVVFIVPLLALLLLAAAGALLSRRQVPPAGPWESVPAVDLVIDAPAQATVASPIEVRVSAAGLPDGTLVVLMVRGTYGPRVYESISKQGAVQFIIPATHMEKAGVYELEAVVGPYREHQTIWLEPGAPTAPLQPYVGARSIVADGNSWSMVVTIPTDAYGNPVREGTPVEVRAQHPGQQLIASETAVQHLLAWERIFSGTQAGRAVITVRAGAAAGPEGELLEVPGRPIPFTITSDLSSLAADGRQLTTLRTGVIVDRYGNIMPDGTRVTFLTRGPGGSTRVIPGYTLNGSAEVFLEAPSIPGLMHVSAVAFGVRSASIDIAFTPGLATEEFTIAHTLTSDSGGILLSAGPLIGPLSQLAPDGTPVLFRLESPNTDEVWHELFSDSGYAVLELRAAELNEDIYTVTAFAGSGSGRLAFSYDAGTGTVMTRSRETDR